MLFYFVSREKMNGEIIYPRVPKNRMSEEDDTTKRICASLSIYGCLNALGFEIGERLYVHTFESEDYMQPTWEQVGDVGFTGELWVMEKVTLCQFAVIEITRELEYKDGETGVNQYAYKIIREFG